ncbi:MAG: flagellin, partial [Planctomycetes bacterium]|nr:flagellin [Planctomycetota bacterium]
RLGALERNMLDTNIRQLQITFENLTASESVIRDTDFAVETTELTRAQILQAAGTSVLAIANAVNQNVLSLLG